VTRAAVKPYPWCASIHSPIDAMLRLVRSHDLSSAGIDEVVVANSDTVLRQCGFTYQGLGGVLEARMSLQYCLAAAAVDRAVGLRQFDDDRRRDPASGPSQPGSGSSWTPRSASSPHDCSPPRSASGLKDGAKQERFVPSPPQARGEHYDTRRHRDQSSCSWPARDRDSSRRSCWP
jgi:MmgE/PrpD C-terminal domain